jgi:sugar transferase (PEP-CTERM/EpsH1 system associated)
MNILIITPAFPFPPDAGGKIVVYHTIRYLSRWHCMHLISFVPPHKKSSIESLRDYCVSIQTVPLHQHSLKDVLLTGMLSNVPYNIGKYHTKEMKKMIGKAIENSHYDLAIIEHLHMAQYVEIIKKHKIPVILREHNIETVMMKRYYENAHNPLEKIYAYVQWLKLRKYESRLVSLFNRCITLSKVDQEHLQNLLPQAKTKVLPCGVDLEYYKSRNGLREKNNIIFIGNLLFKPTFEGVVFFVKQIWPIIKKDCPALEFRILGPYPRRREKELMSQPGISLCGYVQDVRPYMSKSLIAVVPIYIASGVRLKIIEAMAMNLPIVTTSVGCEGLNLIPGKHLLVSDSIEGFARNVLTLINNDELRNRIAENALQLIQDEFSWESVMEKLNILCLETISQLSPSVSTQ